MSVPADLPPGVEAQVAARAAALWCSAMLELRQAVESLPADLPLLSGYIGARLHGAADVTTGDDGAWLRYLAETVDALVKAAVRDPHGGRAA